MTLCLKWKSTPNVKIIFLCLNLILNLVFRAKMISQRTNKQHILKLKCEIIQSIRKYSLWLKCLIRVKITQKKTIELKLDKGET